MKTRLNIIIALLTLTNLHAQEQQYEILREKVVMRDGIFWPKHKTLEKIYVNGRWQDELARDLTAWHDESGFTGNPLNQREYGLWLYSNFPEFTEVTNQGRGLVTYGLNYGAKAISSPELRAQFLSDIESGEFDTSRLGQASQENFQNQMESNPDFAIEVARAFVTGLSSGNIEASHGTNDSHFLTVPILAALGEITQNETSYLTGTGLYQNNIEEAFGEFSDSWQPLIDSINWDTPAL